VEHVAVHHLGDIILYRAIQEERSIILEVILSDIVSKKLLVPFGFVLQEPRDVIMNPSGCELSNAYVLGVAI
jgi:hypothetical protein